MIRRGLILAVLALGLIAAPAAAQTFPPSLESLFTDPAVTPVSLRRVPVHVAGSLDIRYGPDPASGCAAHAGCAYSGRVTFAPGTGAELLLTTMARDGRRIVSADLSFDPTGSGAALTYADVTRGHEGECTDAIPAGVASAVVRHSALALAWADVLGQTRCATPLPADLRAILPPITIPHLVAGQRVDLRFSRHFAAHGFAGTVTSTLVLSLGRPEAPTSLFASSGVPAHRLRAVTVALRLVATRGSLALTLHGAADPTTCSLLDTCGLSGTETLTPRPVSSVGQITAVGPAARPRRDFLAALGLAQGGNPAGLQVVGSLLWHDRGTVTEDVRQGARCQDSAALGDNLLILTAIRRHLGVFAPLAPAGRTRCPGPAFGGFASGLLGTASLGPHDVTVHVTPFGSADDDGLSVVAHGSIALRLHRGRIIDRVILSQLF